MAGIDDPVSPPAEPRRGAAALRRSSTPTMLEPLLSPYDFLSCVWRPRLHVPSASAVWLLASVSLRDDTFERPFDINDITLRRTVPWLKSGRGLWFHPKVRRRVRSVSEPAMRYPNADASNEETTEPGRLDAHTQPNETAGGECLLVVTASSQIKPAMSDEKPRHRSRDNRDLCAHCQDRLSPRR
jgi:hypothetical protein